MSMIMLDLEGSIYIDFVGWKVVRYWMVWLCFCSRTAPLSIFSTLLMSLNSLIYSLF